ncbi:MAG: c-type cytochrome [Acidobacteria bacterium]|nr:c-type cytochrome [Acidobacteriota bacterium]
MGRAGVAALILLAACSHPRPVLSSKPIGKPIGVAAPLGLPLLPAAVTAETVALGRQLFFDPRLSLDASVSCASCHNPKTAFADPRRFSLGVGGNAGVRNAPPVANAAYNRLQFWDGRAATLEEQASGPMMNPVEMAHTPAGVERCCGDLAPLFAAAFGPAPDGGSPVSLERITRALADYERTLLSANSPFDRFFYGGDAAALGPSAQRGLKLFRGEANCAACHLIGARSALFTDGLFHNLGAGMNAEGEIADPGRYAITRRDADQGAFRTPSLRNIALTAPYMHDGSLKSLKEVVDFYVGGGNANPHRDPLLKPLTFLTGAQRADLVAFLKSLTGESKQ